MWWVVWGEYVGADVTVTLADRSRPEVMFFGRLWLTEWCGPEQLAVVSAAGRQSEVRFAPPAFVTPRSRAHCWAGQAAGRMWKPLRASTTLLIPRRPNAAESAFTAPGPVSDTCRGVGSDSLGRPECRSAGGEGGVLL